MRVFGRVGTASALVAALGVVAAGCADDRGVMQTQVGDYLFEFAVDATPRDGRPAGSSTNLGFVVSAVDASHPDALGRMTTGVRGLGYQNIAAWERGWMVPQSIGRNATTDPRLPALQSTTAQLPGRFIIGDPSSGGATHWWNLWTATATGSSFAPITGLKPNTTYTIGFFRYGLQVNGEVDHIQAARGLPITQPDQLVLVGGTPGGDPTVDLWYTNEADVFPVVNANPFILGRFTTNAQGQAILDMWLSAFTEGGTKVLYSGGGGNPPAGAMDSALVARNDAVVTTLPRYNYLVIMEGSATTAAAAAALPQVLRAQIGADLDPTGSAVTPNAYAPFPTAMTQAQLLQGPGVAGQVSSLRVTLSNLAQLAGATYQFWLVNDVTGEAVSVPVNWRTTAPNPDPDIATRVPADSAAGVRTFNSRGDWVHTIEVNDSIAGRAIGTFTHAMISIEGAEAAQPSSSQPLWVRYTDMKGAVDAPLTWTFISPGTVNFGTFNLGNSPLVFQPRGAARGWFWGTDPGDEFRVQYRDLNRPPVGFMYEGWMLPEGGRGAAFSVGELTTTGEDGFASLRDVDINANIGQYVREDRILTALQRLQVGQILNGNPWHVEEYHLKLVPKTRSTADVPPYTILGGPIPDAVSQRAPGGND
jgi:hypothetical protein